jgi:PAS domain S-box-containing protein
MNRLFQALTSAADGAFVINEEQNIIYWNQAAQDILGFAFGEIANQPCYEILAGCDDHDRSICHEHCRVAVTALRGGTLTNFDATVRTKADGFRWVNMSTFTFPANGGENGRVLVHLFRDVTQKKQQEQFIDQVLAAAKNLQNETSLQALSSVPVESRGTDLTDREREVLSLLAQGLSTNDIARSLSITSSTVRNHIRNILQKLHVHNRLEAVIYAFKHGLIGKE